MSNFYLDVVKDILYCEKADGAERRSAQSAMFLILDAMVRLLAPILCFTSDEIWQEMPHRKSDVTENVMFNSFVEMYRDYELSSEQMAEYDKLIEIRNHVNGALETARSEKLIGKPLEAKVIIFCNGQDFELLHKKLSELSKLCIVSQVQLLRSDEFQVKVAKADGEKCERCWTYSIDVGKDSEHPTLCSRCAEVVKNI